MNSAIPSRSPSPSGSSTTSSGSGSLVTSYICHEHSCEVYFAKVGRKGLRKGLNILNADLKYICIMAERVEKHARNEQQDELVQLLQTMRQVFDEFGLKLREKTG